MYGFGGLGEVEVEIWSDVTMAGQRPNERTNKKERQGYSAIGQWKAEMSNDVKYLITNEAEKSTGGSLTSKTAFCNEVRVQFKLNVKTKLQLRESLSAVFRMNSRNYFEC